MSNIRIGGKTPEDIVKQRLEELARQPNGSPPPSPPPSPTSPGTATHENGDEFGIDEIVKSPEGNYEFRGLVIPGGTWDVITLAGRQFENGKKLNHTQWIEYSNGKAGFDQNGQFVPLSTPVKVDFRITPSRVRYWLMRAVYEKRNSRKGKSVIKELRDLFYKDDRNPWQHNAELIEYRSGQNAVITTQGWPASHPFSRTIDAPVAGDSSVEIEKGCNLDDALYVLAGDRNPERVKEVMEYHDQPPNKVTKLWRCSTSTNDKRVVVFGVNDGGSAGIGAYGDVDYDGPARGVFADAKNFHRK